MGWTGHHCRASKGAWGGQVTTTGAAWVHGVDRSPLQGQHGCMGWTGHHRRGSMEDGMLGGFCWHQETEKKAGWLFPLLFFIESGLFAYGTHLKPTFVFAFPLSVRFLLKPSQIHGELCHLSDSKSSQADSGDVSSFSSYRCRNSDSEKISRNPMLFN